MDRIEYPKYLHHPVKGAALVAGPDEEAALGGEWFALRGDAEAKALTMGRKQRRAKPAKLVGGVEQPEELVVEDEADGGSGEQGEKPEEQQQDAGEAQE